MVVTPAQNFEDDPRASAPTCREHRIPTDQQMEYAYFFQLFFSYLKCMFEVHPSKPFSMRYRLEYDTWNMKMTLGI